MTLEEYKDIPEYEGLYKISNIGKVKSLKTGKILKPYCNRYGYLQVTLCKNNKIKLMRIHRLVAKTFINNEQNKPQVNHINGIKIDNRVENLEWVSSSENVKHSYQNKLQKAKRGKDNILSKKVYQYDLSGKLLKIWDSVGDIQRELKIKKQYVSACCLNKCKTTHNFIFKY